MTALDFLRAFLVMPTLIYYDSREVLWTQQRIEQMTVVVWRAGDG